MGEATKLNVKIYSKEYCPFCTRAKQFFNDKGIAYQEIDLTDDFERLDELKKKTNHLTLPQIFVNDEFIGGYSELMDAVSSGKLKF